MDSSAITAGAIQQAQPGLTGTTMAVHSAVGFLGAFLGPLVFGVVLDAFAYSAALSWALAFGAMSLAVAGGPVCIALLHREPVPASPRT
jgi:MFS family permease